MVIAAVLSSTQTSLAVSKNFVDVLNALGSFRVAILVIMSIVLIFREYKSKASAPKSLPEERQSLLENGNGSAANYATVPGSKPAADATQSPQATGRSWLKYIASFRILFPYIW